MKIASPCSVKRYIPALTDCLETIWNNAQHRDDNILFNDIEEYLRYRRENIGGKPGFFPCQMHLNIPDEALFHPVIEQLENLACEMIALDNVSLQLVAFESFLA